MGYGYRKRGSSRNGEIHDSLRILNGANTKLITPSFLSLYRVKNYDLISKSASKVWEIDKDDFL